MKKSTKILFAILIAVSIWLLPTSANSQTVINTPLFASFEDGTVNAFDWYLDTMTGTLQVENNPVTTGVNSSAKCLKFTCTTGGAGWWGKLYMTAKLNHTIQQNTTSHRYLHYLAYTTNVNKYYELQLKDAAGTVVVKPFQPLSQANVWEEVIIDLGASFTGTISEIYIAPCIDWGGGFITGDIYMVDQFTLSNNASTLYTTTSLKDFTSDNKVFSTKNSIEVQNVTGIVNLYNTTGALIRSVRSTGNVSIQVESGLYIVSANGIKTKVLVK